MKNIHHGLIKICLALALLTGQAFALSFGSAANDVPKAITIEGKDYNHVIGTGNVKGKYYLAGQRICQGLNKCIVADTDGSKQNLELLMQGYINGAIVQADAYNSLLDNIPSLKDTLVAVDLDAEEQIQIVMRKGDTEGKLRDKKAVIYIGSLKSGGAASWASMQALEPKYQNAVVVSDDYSATSAIALNKLRNGEFTAVIRTSMAGLDDPFVKQIQQDKDLQFVDVNDKDINDNILINGKFQPMYRFTDMSVEKGFISNKQVEVPAVKVLFVFNKNMYSTQQLNEMLENIQIKKSGLFR